MATTVYTIAEVKLQDDTEVVLKPNSIKGQKKFMGIMSKFGEAKSEAEGLEVLLRAGAVCLMKQRPEFWDKDANDGEGGYTDAFEEALDMETLYKVLDTCGGTKFSDPNLQAAAEAAALGKTST